MAWLPFKKTTKAKSKKNKMKELSPLLATGENVF